MSTVREITLECPICGTSFLSRVAEDAMIGAARLTTDFRESTEGAEVLPFRVHQCPGCGFAGADDEFTREELDAEWAATLREARAPVMSDETTTGAEKYEAAARIAAHRGEGPDAVAELLLRAAWCSVVEHDAEAERYYRREAARAYERALERYDCVRREERARLTYLVGELWRRVGDEARAGEWLGRVDSEVTEPASQQWLVALAEQQRDHPREWLR